MGEDHRNQGPHYRLLLTHAHNPLCGDVGKLQGLMSANREQQQSNGVMRAEFVSSLPDFGFELVEWNQRLPKRSRQPKLVGGDDNQIQFVLCWTDLEFWRVFDQEDETLILILLGDG